MSSSSSDVKVIDVIGDGWVMCQMQNVQGDIFYMSVETNEVSLHPPGSPPAPPLPKGCLTRPMSHGALTPSAPVHRRDRDTMAYSYAQTLSTEDPTAPSIEVRPVSVLRSRPATVVYPKRSTQPTSYSTSQAIKYSDKLAYNDHISVSYGQPAYNDNVSVNYVQSVCNDNVSVTYAQPVYNDNVSAYGRAVTYAQPYAASYAPPVYSDNLSYSRPVAYAQNVYSDRRAFVGYEVLNDQVFVEY